MIRTLQDHGVHQGNEFTWSTTILSLLQRMAIASWARLVTSASVVI